MQIPTKGFMTDAKAIERSESYKAMMNTWAFKDFVEIMGHERQTALEQAVVASKIEDVNVYRGIVKCIDSLLSELDSIVSKR